MTLPAYLTAEQSMATILARMLATFPASVDTAQGSWLQDLEAPAALELAQAATLNADLLTRTFAQTTFGVYLDFRGNERGIYRKQGTPSTGQVTFTGPLPTGGNPYPTILAGTIVQTASRTAAPSVAFVTTAPVTLTNVSGVATGTAPVVAADIVAAVTIPAGAVNTLVTLGTGALSVQNPSALGASSAAGVAFTGPAGLVVPAGTIVATTPAPGVPAVQFITLLAATPGVAVPVQRLATGAATNVAAQAIVLPVNQTVGVTGLANTAPTTGGFDLESDDAFRVRYLFFVRNPSAGGNIADYITWATSIAGVGAVSVVPLKWGAGTVEIAIVDEALNAPAKTLIDQVQAYIAPRWQIVVRATALTYQGLGVTTDPSQTDAGGPCVQLVYNVVGLGEISDDPLQVRLPRPGVWQVRAHVKASAIPGSVGLFSMNIFNHTTAANAQTLPTGGVDSIVTLNGNQLSLTFTDIVVNFYWNGTDVLDFNLDRSDSDSSATAIWCSQIVYESTFPQDTGTGKAPIGASATVVAPTLTAIALSVHLTVSGTFAPIDVQDAVTLAITAYLQSTIFQPDNTVYYAKVGLAILGVPGVVDYSGLTINGGTANIAVAPDAIPGAPTMTWT